MSDKGKQNISFPLRLFMIFLLNYVTLLLILSYQNIENVCLIDFFVCERQTETEKETLTITSLQKCPELAQEEPR